MARSEPIPTSTLFGPFSAQGTARWSNDSRILAFIGHRRHCGPDGTLWLAGDTNVAVNLGGGPRPSSTGRGLFSGHFTGAGSHRVYVIASNLFGVCKLDRRLYGGQIVLGGAVRGDMNFGPRPTLAADISSSKRKRSCPLGTSFLRIGRDLQQPNCRASLSHKTDQVLGGLRRPSQHSRQRHAVTVGFLLTVTQ